MPPPNSQRRAALADAAIRVLAAGGTKGLTHRAVDIEAAEPTGTTSRYFRTRDALLTAVVHRATEVHEGSLEAAGASGQLSEDEVVDQLTTLVQAAVGPHRVRHLAMAELFLQANRFPELKPALEATFDAQESALRALLGAAGILPDHTELAGLLALLSGLVFTLLTGPPAALAETETLVRSSLRRMLLTSGIARGR